MSQSTSIETVFDDESMHVGQVYAKALLAATQAEGSTELVVSQLETIVSDVINQQPAFNAILSNPKIAIDEKERMLDRVLGNHAHPTLLNFLKVLARRRRLHNVRTIQQKVTQLRDDAMGRLQVLVTTAEPLSFDQVQSLESRLASVLNATVSIKTKVDNTIVGGLIVRVGDQVFDGSIDGQLKQLKKASLAKAEQAIRDKLGILAS